MLHCDWLGKQIFAFIGSRVGISETSIEHSPFKMWKSSTNVHDFSLCFNTIYIDNDIALYDVYAE